MDTKRAIGLAMLGLCAAAAPAGAADTACRAQSGERTRPLVELFTSEGCDSCPPADRWVAKAFAPGADEAASVLAFHVDYWDKLGWPDRFASADWSGRQQAIARASRSAAVYTPQVVLQGHDFAEWREADADREVGRASKAPPRAGIAVDAREQGRRILVSATARVPAQADRAGARLLVAYTDGGHVTDVKRGENAGVTLRHEHVVRALATSGPPDASGAIKLESTIEIPAEAGKHPQLVAFVERDARREILQTLSLPLDDCGR
jgi:hypothetical protein